MIKYATSFGFTVVCSTVMYKKSTAIISNRVSPHSPSILFYELLIQPQSSEKKHICIKMETSRILRSRIQTLQTVKRVSQRGHHTQSNLGQYNFGEMTALQVIQAGYHKSIKLFMLQVCK